MKTQFVQVDGGEIAYDDTGSGPLVICVPGLGDLRSGFRFLAAQLVDAGYRVVTMDLRGIGETSVIWDDFSVVGVGKDILALIRHLNAGPAVIVGNSMGAGAAIWAAAEVRELVRGLVLIGPAVHGDLGILFRLALAPLFARPWGPAAWLMYYKTLYPSRKPADWIEYTTRLKQNLSQTGRLEALHKLMLSSKAASEARLEKVNLPALIVMGTRDPDFKNPAGEAQWVAEKLGAGCKMVTGAGHYPHTEMPEITGPLVLDYLAALEQEPAHAATIS